MSTLFSLPTMLDDAHATLRLQENLQRTISLANGTLAENVRQEIRGVSALLWYDGKCGFASSTDVSEAGLKLSMKQARLNLNSLIPARGQVTAATPKRYDFGPSQNDTSQRKLLELAKEVDQRITLSCPNLTGRKVQIETLGVEKQTWTNEGRESHLILPRTNIQITMTAPNKDGRMVSVRDSIGGLGFAETVIQDLGSVDTLIQELFEDLMQKCSAKQVELGEQPCILSGCTGILIHEAFGHIAEGDSVLEGSVLSGKIGQQLVSPLISATDFANSAFGMTVPQPRFLDDEGTPCVDAPLLRDGILVGYMHDRSTSLATGMENTGNAWAQTFSYMPIVRMRNTAIHPGNSSLEEMIASMERGIFVKRTGGGQADQTGKFMFSVQSAYAVEHGRLTHALPDMVCQGSSFHTLGRVTMVGNDLTWRFSSMCGKSGQVIPVGMSGPAIKSIASFYGG